MKTYLKGKSVKKAFTMIELIFVIVIIGILAAVAIPKLAATRNDAKVSKAISNLRTCVLDIGVSYTGRQIEDNTTSACEEVSQDGCFLVDITGAGGSETDGNLTVTHSDLAEFWCTEAKTFATDLNLSQATPGQVHSFGGSSVVR